MGKALQYGLVGYSLTAMEHITELESPKLVGRTKLVAAFDPNPKAREYIQKLDQVKATETFEDLLDIPRLEAIIIASPPQFHADQAVAALESGLHVYSEVPMAINKKDVVRIIDAEENSNKKYQLGENYCFIPEVLYAGHLAASGKIGPTVYSESEYLHDVTYRWREGSYGDESKTRVDSWYQLFDPLMYAHTIGPAQVALAGIEKPAQFIETSSFANDIGGFEGKPISSPAKSFQVGLFRTESGAIAKCANAYIFAREPTRLMIQVIGRTGTYECYTMGKPGRLFLAKGHTITKTRHRKGKAQIIDKSKISEIIPFIPGLYFGASIRIMDDWLLAIELNKLSLIHSKIAANFCLSGIAASESARSGGKPIKIKTFN
ncbi:MAG: Gfo/Idh/MocA family protein [Promethearchaeota archaeon]